ncbi:MAG TPA: hypothetical protein VFU88_00195 [Ktedonobacterales bacterium]|nr:hypothetical protein [Ktedonobacterales bacterium]
MRPLDAATGREASLRETLRVVIEVPAILLAHARVEGSRGGVPDRMIRPVPYVDLPGIVYALDRRARARAGEFATFVVAPASPEPRSALAAFLSATHIFAPTAYTWICEDRWHLLGVAQTIPRPGHEAWDLTYLAALTPSHNQPPVAGPGDVLAELAQRALDVAITRGVQRLFARVEDDCPQIEIFGKLGFQRYARELTYALDAPQAGLAALEKTTPAPLRHWHPEDAWGLLRLYDAVTPHRVRIAEGMSLKELLHARAGGARTWHLPLIEPMCQAWVCDRGVRLGGWIRLRRGRGSQPHQLWLMVHPDEPETAPALVRAALEELAREAPRPIICQAREYEGAAIDGLRAAGFEHADTYALLVRHLTVRALRRREVAALETRVVYGVKGLGNTPSRLSEGETTHYATRRH